MFGFVLSGFLLSGQPTQNSRSNERELSMEKIIQEAGLDLRNPTEQALSKVGSLLRIEEKKGIWLAAPTPLAIGQDTDATIYGFDFYSTHDRPGRYFKDSAVVVVTRVESRETFANLVIEPIEKDPDKPTPEPDTTPRPEIKLLQRFSIRLRERLEELPWRTGTYLVDVLFDNQVSNRAQFQLTAGLPAEKDPAIVAFIEQQRAAEGGPKELFPLPGGSGKYPNYRKTEDSLPVPSGVGIHLEAERVSVYKADAQSVLRGSFRLPVPAAYYRNSSGDGSATAAVPITLVLAGNLMPGPFVAPLRVASYDPIDRKAAESTVTGQFEIDLFALQETSKVPQTYTIWAYSGTARSTPVQAAVITPEMLK